MLVPTCYQLFKQSVNFNNPFQYSHAAIRTADRTTTGEEATVGETETIVATVKTDQIEDQCPD